MDSTGLQSVGPRDVDHFSPDSYRELGERFADKYLENDRVTFTYFGDGAANQGQVYETFNMASLWKLPVRFEIVYTQYAMGTSQLRSTSTPDIYTRGAGFDIPGEAVDGMDVLSVKAAGDKAVKYCRAGKGPYILEIKTYRYRGHSMSDAQHYRTKDEVEEYRKIDPITQVKDVILSKNYATQKELDVIDKSIKERVADCEKYAESSPYPDLSLLYDAVYEQEDYPFIKHKL